MDDRDVSVIIATYNGSDFIEAAMNSVFEQTLLPKELIIVDDCSQDDTLQKASKYVQSTLVSVQVIKRTSNSGGPSVPTNAGIRASTGSLVAVLDQDDVFDSRKLELQASLLRRHPDVSIVGGLATDWNDKPLELSGKAFPREILAQMEKRENAWVSPKSGTDLILRNGMFLIGYPSFMFRRSDWERSGGINEQLKIVGDFDFACRLAQQGRILLHPEVVYYRRNHANNLSGNRVAMYLEDAAVRARLLSESPYCNDLDLRHAMARHCLWVAYHFRNAGLLKPGIRMLKYAAEFGASKLTLARQIGLLLAQVAFIRGGLLKRQYSGVTSAPWKLSQS